jgi:YD repeat-containing protein
MIPMATRPASTIGGVNHTLTYDAENRLITVKQGTITIAGFAYDGDVNRIQSTVNLVDLVSRVPTAARRSACASSPQSVRSPG